MMDVTVAMMMLVLMMVTVTMTIMEHATRHVCRAVDVVEFDVVVPRLDRQRFLNTEPVATQRPATCLGYCAAVHLRLRPQARAPVVSQG